MSHFAKNIFIIFLFTIIVFMAGYVINMEGKQIAQQKEKEDFYTLKQIRQEITLNSKSLSELNATYQRLDLQIRGIAAECGKITLECKK